MTNLCASHANGVVSDTEFANADVLTQTNIDWAGIALERVTGLTLNEYLQKHVLQPLGLNNMSMIPTPEMRAKLAYMHAREKDGTLRPRDHLLRSPLVVNPNDSAAVKAVFNSGGAGMFAKPQEYCSKLKLPSPVSLSCSSMRSLLG